MKSPKEKANELVQDFIEMQPRYLDKIGVDFKQSYEFAKQQAKYCAHVAKFSNPQESGDFEYWYDVQKEIDKL